LYLLFISEIKERIKKTKDEKRAKKVEVTKSQKTAGRGNAPKPGKAPKLGGGGGKR
jgi:large subunit ribosomal protein L24e